LLTLDDDELRAAASLLNASPRTEDAASIAVGKVRLQARGLLSAGSLGSAVAEALRTCLWPDDRLSVEVQRRTGEAISVTFCRLGTRVVAHSRAQVPGGELHTFASVGDVVDSVVALLRAPAETPAFATQVLELDGLEQARHAAGDRQAMATALQAAGADTQLTRQLVDAFLGADTLARLTRSGEPARTVTVMSVRDEVWTFATEGESTAKVERPSAESLRVQLESLWAR
jgi:hypothetical protein